MAKKKLNTRCPLQVECERKCTYEGHELDCDYYFNNAVGEDRTIEDQELIRAEREREVYEAEYEAELAAVDEEDHLPDATKMVYLPIDRLHPHPDNPRKDVGDVSELAESIKAKGVLQNLTVVPGHYLSDEEMKKGYAEYAAKPSEELRVILNRRWTNADYTVLIGHRRLAGAKLAGLTELPCSIVEMSIEDQVATMLVENMQRSDLTVYEEAKGFQMMLDLGKSVKEVSDMSGFSESTVRKRVKLAELDEAKFKKAVDRGATLFDFAELDKIEDPTTKDKLLDSIGKADFQNELKRELEKQKDRKKLEHYVEEVSKWAAPADKTEWGNGHKVAKVGNDTIEVDYVRNYGTYGSSTAVVEKPDDADERRYFFIRSSYSVDIYAELTEALRAEKAAQDAERQEKRDREEAITNEFRTITARHYQLRRDFILNFNQFKQKSVEVAEFISDTMVMYGMERRYGSEDIELLSELLGVPLNEAEDSLDYHEFLRIKKEFPERTMLIIAFWLRDDADEGYWQNRWDSTLAAYRRVFNENENLSETYRLLKWLGYEMSTEEEQMYKGTHHMFDATNDDEDDYPEDGEDE